MIGILKKYLKTLHNMILDQSCINVCVRTYMYVPGADKNLDFRRRNIMATKGSEWQTSASVDRIDNGWQK